MSFLKRAVFLKLIHDKWVLWDYENHKQYELDEDSFKKLYELTSPSDNKSDQFISQLITLKLTSSTQTPEPWGWDELSHIFHIGTMDVQSPWKNTDEASFVKDYVESFRNSFQNAPEVPKIQTTSSPIKLPIPNLEKLHRMSLAESLNGRRTCREFLSQSIPLEALSTVLFASFGFAHGVDPQLDNPQTERFAKRKFSPSPGNTHPEEVFIQIQNVTGIQPGIYHYSSEENTLAFVAENFSEDELTSIFLGQFFHSNAAYVIFLTSRFDKLWWKYKHSRAYRMTQLTTGCLVQSFQLINRALDFDTWMTGHFHDTSIISRLALPEFCYPTFVLAAGKSTGQSIPKSFKSE